MVRGIVWKSQKLKTHQPIFGLLSEFPVSMAQETRMGLQNQLDVVFTRREVFLTSFWATLWTVVTEAAMSLVFWPQVTTMMSPEGSPSKLHRDQHQVVSTQFVHRTFLQSKRKCTYPAFILAFSAKLFGLYSIRRACRVGVTGLLVNWESIAPSKAKLCIEPGDIVPFALKYGLCEFKVPYE